MATLEALLTDPAEDVIRDAAADAVAEMAAEIADQHALIEQGVLVGFKPFELSTVASVVPEDLEYEVFSLYALDESEDSEEARELAREALAPLWAAEVTRQISAKSTLALAA